MIFEKGCYSLSNKVADVYELDEIYNCIIAYTQ